MQGSLNKINCAWIGSHLPWHPAVWQGFTAAFDFFKSFHMKRSIQRSKRSDVKKDISGEQLLHAFKEERRNQTLFARKGESRLYHRLKFNNVGLLALSACFVAIHSQTVHLLPNATNSTWLDSSSFHPECTGKYNDFLHTNLNPAIPNQEIA